MEATVEVMKVKQEVQVRVLTEHDAAAVAALFYHTVHSVNVADYSEEQLNAWAPMEVLHEDWSRRFDDRLALVATYSDEVVGFADMDVRKHYLDRLYVHREYQRCGVGTALCDALESVCRCNDKRACIPDRRTFFYFSRIPR